MRKYLPAHRFDQIPLICPIPDRARPTDAAVMQNGDFCTKLRRNAESYLLQKGRPILYQPIRFIKPPNSSSNTRLCRFPAEGRMHLMHSFSFRTTAVFPGRLSISARLNLPVRWSASSHNSVRETIHGFAVSETTADSFSKVLASASTSSAVKSITYCPVASFTATFRLQTVPQILRG